MTLGQKSFSRSLKILHDLPLDPGLAFLLPGQGAQKVGMGLEAYESSPAARAVFESADDVLDAAISRLCFQGPEEELTRTVNAQPAILVTSLAILAAALDSGAIDRRPAFLAGHSLGEYTALVIAGSLEFDDCLRLVRERGRLMEMAGTQNPGTMAAIVGLNAEEVRELCAVSGACECNFNARTQIVVGGAPEAVERACALAREGGGRGLPMKVAGAFHTPLMDTAAASFKIALNEIAPADLAIPVIGNASAQPLQTGAEVIAELGRQMATPVLWYQSVLSLLESDITKFLELGPGRTLTAMLKRDFPELTLMSLDSDAIPAGAPHV
jgi:[acyl-carrier-protein] S-malonyltransferase